MARRWGICRWAYVTDRRFREGRTVIARIDASYEGPQRSRPERRPRMSAERIVVVSAPTEIPSMPNVSIPPGGRVMVISVAALVAIDCAHPRPQATDDRARIEAATQHYAAMLRGAPVDSVVAVYAEDGELTIPGVGTLHGRKAIHDFLAPLASAVTVASADMVVDSLAITGNVAEARGHYAEVAGPTGGASQEYRGTYHATWTRQADGQWRIVRLAMQPNAKVP